MTNEEKVLSFVAKHRDSTLDFRSFGGRGSLPENEEEIIRNKSKTLDVEDFVEYILELTRIYRSFNPEFHRTETFPGRNRSALDIWRHTKKYLPEITIFEVMRILYKLDRKTFKCCTIHRRVFPTNGGWFSDHSDIDEFGLHWSSWKNIGL